MQADYTQRVKKHRRELGKEMIAARQARREAKIKYDKFVIENKVYCYDDESETDVLVRDNYKPTTRIVARGSLYMRSADYRRHLSHPLSPTNQDGSGSVNGGEEQANDSAQNESEVMGGAVGGTDGDTVEDY